MENPRNDESHQKVGMCSWDPETFCTNDGTLDSSS
ncbi:uncharacterized protein G2W53_018844 [Senna tora]|uniref:Uncharacterized protein n=1 Tax=Senna tora TaxID=362788 RepID=A0A834TWJ6_9FABA|nr:uncharacterized protein G2W53_018844 [Senna tora]